MPNVVTSFLKKGVMNYYAEVIVDIKNALGRYMME